MNFSNNSKNNNSLSNLNSYDFNFSNNKKLSIPKSFQVSSNISFSSLLPNNNINNTNNSNKDNNPQNIFRSKLRLNNSFDKSRSFSVEDNGNNIIFIYVYYINNI